MIYRLVRNLHLMVGVFSAVFLTAYAVSAVQMAYPLVRLTPTEHIRVLDVPADVETTGRAMAAWLMRVHAVRGDLSGVSAGGDALSLTITRPGTVHQVRIDRATRQAHVTTRVQGAIGMLNRIHHVRGLAHDYWVITAWGWFLLAVSLGLLVLASTGVVMWFRRHRERTMGAVVLIGGLAWGLTLLLIIRS